MDQWWPQVRDILITGAGLAVILSQVLLQVLWARSPSDVLLAAGLALTVPAGYAHARTVLPFGQAGAGSSSPPSPPPGLPPSGPSSPGDIREA